MQAVGIWFTIVGDTDAVSWMEEGVVGKAGHGNDHQTCDRPLGATISHRLPSANPRVTGHSQYEILRCLEGFGRQCVLFYANTIIHLKNVEGLMREFSDASCGW